MVIDLMHTQQLWVSPHNVDNDVWEQKDGRYCFWIRWCTETIWSPFIYAEDIEHRAARPPHDSDKKRQVAIGCLWIYTWANISQFKGKKLLLVPRIEHAIISGKDFSNRV